MTTTIGQRIKARRDAAGLTQQQLAEAASVSQPAVSDWENDRATPTISKVGSLAKALGVDLSWLVYGDEAPVAAEPPAPAEGAA